MKNHLEALQRELNECRTRLHIAETSNKAPCTNCQLEKGRSSAIKDELNAVRSSMDLLDSIGAGDRPLIDPASIKEKKFCALTGMHLSTFRHVFKFLEPYARRATYWRGPALTSPRKTPVSEKEKATEKYEQEFIMFLVRLRLNLNVELLAMIFRCSVGHVSAVFNTWVDLFSTQLERAIYFPEQFTAWAYNPPKVAEKFERLRCIVDCSEIEIQRPQAPYLQRITWSNYKKRNTVKFLVAILGNGAVGFISKAYVGRTSDKFIMNHCGLMNLLSPGDQVLADRGFSINDEMLLRSIDLNTPPAGTGVAQFTTEQAFDTKKIANIRIYVEQAIRRMKCYSILSGTLPINVLPVVDKILKSVSILGNLQDELVR